MSEEKIDKAIAGAVSNVNVEGMHPTIEELHLIKEALQKKTRTESLMRKIIQLTKKDKEEDINDKSKK